MYRTFHRIVLSNVSPATESTTTTYDDDAEEDEDANELCLSLMTTINAALQHHACKPKGYNTCNAYTSRKNEFQLTFKLLEYGHMKNS